MSTKPSAGIIALPAWVFRQPRRKDKRADVDPQHDNRCPWRCVRCGTVRWHYVSEALRGEWPVCHERGCEDEWDCMELVPLREAMGMMPERKDGASP